MGIYGLTSYVANHASDCFQDHKLHDCVVLVDGNSAASLIYSVLTKSNHAFGGDYDKYARSTTEFVELLSKCNVRPVFMFDGGYEQRKLKTLIERIKMNIIICGQYKHKYREGRSFPLLLRDVFKMVLHSLDIPVIQCDFEADHEIITLAKILRCPVISCDSDFYLSNVQYIPFTSIEFRTVRFKKKTNKRRYYVPCRVFDEEKFLAQLGGLENKAMLPLLSCALGNDYVPTNTFKNFLGMDYMTKFDDRIKRIVKWLRTITSVENAVDQMLHTLVRNNTNIKSRVKQLIHEFNRTSSTLLQHLPVDLVVNTVEENLNELSMRDLEQSDITLNDLDESASDLIYLSSVQISPDDDSIIELDEEEYEISYSDSNSENEEPEKNIDIKEQDLDATDKVLHSRNLSADNIYSEIHIDLELPAWLSEKFRRGLISPTVMNVLNFQRIFILSQSEDYFCRPSHELCIPVLQLSIGVILGEKTDVQCYARSRCMLIGVRNISPVLEIPSVGLVPNLKTVPDFDLEFRMNVIREGLGIAKKVDLNRFPKEWRLYIITLIYWKKNCAQCTVNSSHIRTLLVCLIYLSIIDKKIGFARCNNDLKNLRKTFKINQSAKDTVAENEERESNQSDCEISFYNKYSSQEYLEQVSEDDCFRAANTLVQYHRMDENLLKNRKQFNKKTVHAFAQLQNCMQSITLLNSILNFPFVQYSAHELFSGTFIYNFYTELNGRKLADGYITRTLLAKANSLIALYRHLMNSWEVCNSAKEKRPEMKNRKSRKRKNMKKSQVEEVIKVDDIDEGYEDPDNIFSLLGEE